VHKNIDKGPYLTKKGMRDTITSLLWGLDIVSYNQ